MIIFNIISHTKIKFSLYKTFLSINGWSQLYEDSMKWTPAEILYSWNHYILAMGLLHPDFGEFFIKKSWTLNGTLSRMLSIKPMIRPPLIIVEVTYGYVKLHLLKEYILRWNLHWYSNFQGKIPLTCRIYFNA